jgi:hypothetical protein
LALRRWIAARSAQRTVRTMSDPAGDVLPVGFAFRPGTAIGRDTRWGTLVGP